MLTKEQIISEVRSERLFGDKDFTKIDQDSLKTHFPVMYEMFKKYHEKKLKHISREERLDMMINEVYSIHNQ